MFHMHLDRDVDLLKPRVSKKAKNITPIPQFGEFTMGTIKNLINSANDPSNHPSLVGG